MASRHVLLDDIDEPGPSKRKRRVVRTEQPITVALQFKAADTSDVKKVCLTTIYETSFEYCG